MRFSKKFAHESTNFRVSRLFPAQWNSNVISRAFRSFPRSSHHFHSIPPLIESIQSKKFFQFFIDFPFYNKISFFVFTIERYQWRNSCESTVRNLKIEYFSFCKNYFWISLSIKITTNVMLPTAMLCLNVFSQAWLGSFPYLLPLKLFLLRIQESEILWKETLDFWYLSTCVFLLINKCFKIVQFIRMTRQIH